MSDYNHEHKYFLFETKATFEPVPDDDLLRDTVPERTLYERIEYAILACNCGDTIKRKVRQENGNTTDS